MSRAYITGDAGCGAPEDMNMLVHSLVENLPATIDKLEQFRRAFAKDQVMQSRSNLSDTDGHSANQRALPRFKRTGIYATSFMMLMVYGSSVTAYLRPDMLQVIHEGHLGRDKCKARARESL